MHDLDLGLSARPRYSTCARHGMRARARVLTALEYCQGSIEVLF